MFRITNIYSVFLAMHYTGHVTLAFESVEHIMRDIPFGWLLRYAHSNGASFFFYCCLCTYIKRIILRSYSNPKDKLWISGVAILLIMMGTAFMVMFFLGDK